MSKVVWLAPRETPRSRAERVKRTMVKRSGSGGGAKRVVLGFLLATCLITAAVTALQSPANVLEASTILALFFGVITTLLMLRPEAGRVSAHQS